MWRDHHGRTWVAVSPSAEHLPDRTVRAVASGTRRGTIEWPIDGDAAAEGLFAARRALLEGIRPGADVSVALPKVEGVLTGGRGIVVERPDEQIEQWWDGIRNKKDRLARLLDGMSDLARSAGLLVGPSEAEGLVPVIRPRSLRRRGDGGWVVTEFAALIDSPPAADSPEVCTGFLPPEAVQGLPARTGSARVSWGIGATLLAICRWARATLDGSSGDPIESPAGHAHRGRLLADAHARGLFRGGGAALRQAVDEMPDADRLPTPDREAILGFSEDRGLVRPFGVGLISLLDDILVVDPSKRPTPAAIAERLEVLAREVRTELARRRREARAKRALPSEPEVDDAPAAPAPEPPPEPVRKRPPPSQRALDGLQRKVHELNTQLEETRLQVERMRTDVEILSAQVRKQNNAPTLWPQLIGLTVAVGVALAMAGVGIVLPLHPEAPVAQAPAAVTVAGPQTRSGASALPAEDVPSSATGTVRVRGGTVSLAGLRGVYGGGPVPVGDYTVTAIPHGAAEVDLGPVRVLEGGILEVNCAFGSCTLEVAAE